MLFAALRVHVNELEARKGYPPAKWDVLSSPPDGSRRVFFRSRRTGRVAKLKVPTSQASRLSIPLTAKTSFGEILIRGARLHNLKNLTLSIPHNKLTVITGVSGSGKSSLAFDTIYAEGQRRYVESLSAYARQFLERMEKPAVDEIDGIAPAIAIRQKNSTRNPRSTVATATEIYDFMRLLWARAGRTWCPVCGRRVQKDTVDQVADRMLAEPEGERFLVLFPVKHETGQIPKEVLTELRTRGFNRLWQDGKLFEFSTPESLLDIDWSQPVYVLADRIAISPDLHQRIVDTVEACYRESGDVIFLNARDWGAAPLQRAVHVQVRPARVPGTGADPVQLQQPRRRVPALPGFRQHHRLCARPDRSESRPFVERRRRRALDQAEGQRLDERLPRASRRPCPLRRPFLRSDRRGAAAGP